MEMGEEQGHERQGLQDMWVVWSGGGWVEAEEQLGGQQRLVNKGKEREEK